MAYWRQSAFDRQVNQERNELTQQTWMETHQQQFMANAKDLGVIDDIRPERKVFDLDSILGAARLRMKTL